MKLFVRYFINATISIVISCIFIELLLRVLSLSSYQIRFFSSNPYQQAYLDAVRSSRDITNLFCCQQPNGVINGFTLNSLGYFTPERPYAKPPLTKRLILIGDSQAVGVVPYEDNFISLAEKQIQESSASAVEVINLGAIGFGPLMEEKVLALEGVKYQPDIVLLAFFVGNDFYDDTVYKDRYKQAKHRLPLWVYQSRLFSFLRNSIRFAMFSNGARLRILPLSPQQTGEQQAAATPVQSFSEAEYLYLEKERAGIMIPDSHIYDNLEQVKASIIRMKDITERAGATFLVVIIPDEFQVNKTLFQQITEGNGSQAEAKVAMEMAQYLYRPDAEQRTYDPAQYRLTLPQEILTDFFMKNNIRYIDPLPIWQNINNGSEYYAPRNTHLSKYGNEMLAEIIVPVIQGVLFPQ